MTTTDDTPEAIEQRRRAALAELSRPQREPWTRLGAGCVAVPAEVLRGLVRAARAARRADLDAARLLGGEALGDVPYEWQRGAR